MVAGSVVTHLFFQDIPGTTNDHIPDDLYFIEVLALIVFAGNIGGV